MLTATRFLEFSQGKIDEQIFTVFSVRDTTECWLRSCCPGRLLAAVAASGQLMAPEFPPHTSVWAAAPELSAPSYARTFG